MAKQTQRKQLQDNSLTYKQLARARRETRIRRQVLIAGGALAAVILTIVVVGIVSELIVKPGQPVARVGNVEIATDEFQERVRYERAQTIELIYQYASLFGVEQVYGVAAQLDDYEAVGEQVLDAMVDEILIRQAAADMGLEVSESEVSGFIEQQFGYYREGTPTPLPTFTPRPSATPITPTDVLPTPLPTITPRPSPTLVTEQSFRDTYEEQLRELRRSGIKEETYRSTVSLQLLVEEVRVSLMAEVPLEADQVELNVLSFTTQEEALGYQARLQAGESFDDLMDEATANAEDGISASQVSWAPLEDLAERYGSVAAQVAFALPISATSEVLTTADGQQILVQVTGHEIRELSTSFLSRKEETLYSEWLQGLRDAADIEKYDYWVDRVPQTPTIDTQRLIPTPTPEA